MKSCLAKGIQLAVTGALALGCVQQVQAADIIATTASVYLFTPQDSYLGYSRFTDTDTFIHGVNGVFHNIQNATEEVYITVSADDRLSFNFAAPPVPLSQSPSGRVPLQVGMYNNVTEYPWASVSSKQPSMAVSINSSGHSNFTGWFNVLDIAYDEQHLVTAIAVDFSLQSLIDPSASPLFGSLRFNSTIPLTVVPEPGTGVLIGLGLGALAITIRRRGIVAGR